MTCAATTNGCMQKGIVAAQIHFAMRAMLHATLGGQNSRINGHLLVVNGYVRLWMVLAGGVVGGADVV